MLTYSNDSDWSLVRASVRAGVLAVCSFTRTAGSVRAVRLAAVSLIRSAARTVTVDRCSLFFLTFSTLFFKFVGCQ